MKHFLSKSAATLGGETKALTQAAMQVLQAFAFPGNVRQLENICHWITVMAPGSVVDVADLPPEVRSSDAAAAPAGMVDSSMASAASTVTVSTTTAEPASSTSAPSRPVALPPLSPSTVATNGSAHGSEPRNGGHGGDWQAGLAAALAQAIQQGERVPGDRLTREFEATMIRAALAQTRGRRIEASEWLGWGRNTLTRKIHELGMDGEV